MQGNHVFTNRNDAVARVFGCTPGPKNAQKAWFEAMFNDFQRCWALFGLHRAPAPTKPKNDPREPKNETQKPQRPRMIPKRPKMTPQEAQNEPQEAPEACSLLSFLLLFVVLFLWLFLWLLWLLLFCWCGCCSRWSLVVRCCFWVFVLFLFFLLVAGYWLFVAGCCCGCCCCCCGCWLWLLFVVVVAKQQKGKQTHPPTS